MASVKTTVREPPTEIITVIDKPVEEVEIDVIEDEEPEEIIEEIPEEILEEELTEEEIIEKEFHEETINDRMVIQRLDNFAIVGGRAMGQITFTATPEFNPIYYGKRIVNIVQFQTPNGVNILPMAKQNTLRFTATERTETLTYNEDMAGNTRATLSSFVWSDVTAPTPFSKPLIVEISETEEAKPISLGIDGHGFLSAGVAAGSIALLMLIGVMLPDKK